MKQKTIKTIIVEFTEEEFYALTSILHKVSEDKIGTEAYNLLNNLYQGESTH